MNKKNVVYSESPKKVKQLVLASRNPESVLSVLSEKGVPVQQVQRQETE